MSSDVFWKSPPWRHLNAVPQVNCSTRLVHWQQNSCRHRLSLCAEQTAGTRWLIADVNGRSSTCSTRTDILEPVHGGTWTPERLSKHLHFLYLWAVVVGKGHFLWRSPSVHVILDWTPRTSKWHTATSAQWRPTPCAYLNCVPKKTSIFISSNNSVKN